MIPIKRTCRFVLDKEKNKPDARVRFRIRWNGYIVAFLLGYRVEIDKWIPEAQRCKANTTHGVDKIPAFEINRALQEMEDDIDEIFYSYEILDKTPTKEELKEDYNRVLGKVKDTELSFYQVYNLFIKTVGVKNSWSAATYEKFHTLKKHLKNFDKDLSFKDLSEEKLSTLVRYFQSKKALRVSGLEGDHGLRNTTIKSKLVFVRWFLRWAYENGYYKGNLHTTFKPRLRGSDMKEVIALSWEELMTIYYFYFKEDSLSRVRDVFCFCCFTGLRYSDVAKLKKEDIFEDYINVVTQKTEDRLTIDLNKYSKFILNKYKDIELENDKALPVISNQKMNNQLKIVGKKCGLNEVIREVYFVGSSRFEEVYQKWELLTTHCGRRTFVVNALTLGIPAEVIMKWTGHKDFKTMKPYIKIVDKLKAKEMDKFNQV